MQDANRNILKTARALQEVGRFDPKDGEIVVLRTAIGLLRQGIEEYLAGDVDGETLRKLLVDTEGLEDE